MQKSHSNLIRNGILEPKRSSTDAQKIVCIPTRTLTHLTILVINMLTCAQPVHSGWYSRAREQCMHINMFSFPGCLESGEGGVLLGGVRWADSVRSTIGRAPDYPEWQLRALHKRTESNWKHRVCAAFAVCCMCGRLQVCNFAHTVWCVLWWIPRGSDMCARAYVVR